MSWPSSPSARKAMTAKTIGCGRLIREARVLALGAVTPGRQVRLLLARERVDLDADRGELEPGDLEVDLARHHVDLSLERLALLHHELGGERLVGEAHVHDGGRMPLRRRQVDEAPFAEHEYAATAAELEFLDERPHDLAAVRQLGERLEVDLDVEVAGVAYDGAVLQACEVLP